MSVPGYRLIGPLAYRGKKGCTSVTCTHYFEGGRMLPDCYGWHCSYCDEPCGSQGHRCDASVAILDEAKRVMDEEDARAPEYGDTQPDGEPPEQWHA